MAPVRVGIIGTGFIANVAHLPSLISIKDVDVVALCDRDHARLLRTANMYRIRRTYSDYREMLAQEKLDCVFCLTSLKTHANIAKDCLESGTYVFCEKPLAWTIQEAKEINKASQYSGRWVQIGYNRLFTPVYVRAMSFFEDRQVRLCIAEKNYERDIPPKFVLQNRLIHSICLLNWFCGKPSRVQVEMLSFDSEEINTISALIRYKSGAIANLVGDNSGGTWIERLEVYGDGCTVRVNAPFRVTTFLNSKKEVYEPAAKYYYPWHSLFGYQQQDEHFIDCAKKGNEPWPSVKEELEILNVIHRICKKGRLKSMQE